jgi:hypothetical protein
MIRASKLFLAAVALAALPAAALAGDCDHDVRRPASWTQPPPRPAPPAPARAAWHDARWREHELTLLRAEFRALDDERARFLARHHRHPGKVRKFEREHAARRAELESRWYALQPVAYRW